jgi:hypothetical protein
MMTYCACAARHHPAGKDRRFEQWGSPLEDGSTSADRTQIAEKFAKIFAVLCLEFVVDVQRVPSKRLSFTIAINERSQCLWTICRHGDAGLLCAGKAQSMVYLCFRVGLCAGFGLWLSARRVAVRRSGSCVVSGGSAPVVAGAFGKMTFAPGISNRETVCSVPIRMISDKTR